MEDTYQRVYGLTQTCHQTRAEYGPICIHQYMYTIAPEKNSNDLSGLGMAGRLDYEDTHVDVLLNIFHHPGYYRFFDGGIPTRPDLLPLIRIYMHFPCFRFLTQNTMGVNN